MSQQPIEDTARRAAHCEQLQEHAPNLAASCWAEMARDAQQQAARGKSHHEPVAGSNVHGLLNSAQQEANRLAHNPRALQGAETVGALALHANPITAIGITALEAERRAHGGSSHGVESPLPIDSQTAKQLGREAGHLAHEAQNAVPPAVTEHAKELQKSTTEGLHKLGGWAHKHFKHGDEQ